MIIQNHKLHGHLDKEDRKRTFLLRSNTPSIHVNKPFKIFKRHSQEPSTDKMDIEKTREELNMMNIISHNPFLSEHVRDKDEIWNRVEDPKFLDERAKEKF